MKGIGKIAIYTLLLIGATSMIMPFAWMIVTSFKLPSEVEEWPPQWGSKNFLTKRPIRTVKDYEGTSLILDVDDDPFIRGEIHILFPEGIDYTENVPAEKIRAFFEKYKDIFEKKPEDFEDPGELAVYIYKTLRENLTKTKIKENLIVKLKNLQASFKILERYTSRLPEEEKEKMTSFLKNLEGKLTINLQDFERTYSTFEGAYLPSEDTQTLATKLLEISATISKVPLLESKIGKGIMKLFLKKVKQPFDRIKDIYVAYPEFLSLLRSVQKRQTGSAEIIARFKTKEEKIQMLEKNFTKDPDLREIWSKLEEKARKNPDKFFNEVQTYLQIKSKEALETLKGEISFFLKTGNAQQIIKDLGDILKKMIDVSYGKGIDVGKLIETSLNSKELFEKLKERAISAAESMEEYKSFYRMEGLKTTLNAIGEAFQRLQKNLKDDPIIFLRKLYEVQRKFSHLELVAKKAFELSVNRMNIVRKPSFVKNVSIFIMKGKDMTIEHLKLDLTIHSFNLLDDDVKMIVFFSPGEVFKNIFQNYVDAWHIAPFARYYLNTVFVASTTTILEVIIASMAAFAFSILTFPGRDFLFGLFLATMMVPGEVLLVPNFITITKLGWIDTYYALIVPWIVSVFAIFLIRQHFLTLPRELYDAAKIDGCSNWRYLWTIAIPLSKPVIITGALLKFVGSWNAFLWVLIVTNDERYRTLPVGLHSFSSEAGTLYNQLMAAATFSVLPVIILFLFVQKYFIQGIARTGLK